MLFEFMDWCVEISPAFIHFWTDALNESFLNEIKAISETIGLKTQSTNGKKPEPQTFHVCCAKSHASQEDRKTFSQVLQKLILDEDGSDSILLSS